MTTEFGVVPQEGRRLYTPHDLERALNSPLWRHMAPNLPVQNDLEPATLDAAQIEDLVTAMLHPYIGGASPGLKEGAAAWDAAPQVLNAAGGQLEKVGRGDSRACYKYTDHQGQSMAVILGGYQGSLGLDVPSLRHLTALGHGSTESLWSYSDLRTYLVLPVDYYRAVFLQEWGGAPEPTTRGGHLFAGLAMRAARRRLWSELVRMQLADPEQIVSELKNPRRYVYKSGRLRAALIDIPIAEHVG